MFFYSYSKYIFALLDLKGLNMKNRIEKLNIESDDITTSDYVLYLLIMFLALPIITGLLLIWFKM